MNTLIAALPTSWLGFIVRILVACLCGCAIGFERTKRLKEAGIRTHCIIAAASAILMILSKYGFADMVTATGDNYAGSRGADVSRIAAQVVSGISFLGAGVIFKNGNSVKGLTTAAGIWATAAVGLAIGCGMYWLGITGTILVVIIQLVFHRFSIGNDAFSENDLRVVAKDSETLRNSFQKMVDAKQVQILSVHITSQPDGSKLYNITLRTKKDLSFKQTVELFDKYPEIVSVSF